MINNNGMVGDSMIYNFNFSNLFDKKNGKKFIILGVILLAIGTYCITKKNVGINIFSWGIGIAFVYGAWLSLRRLNELSRYADKNEIFKARLNCIGLFIIAILLFIFPKYVNIVLSVLLGVFLVYREIVTYISYKRFSRMYFGTANLVKLLIGIALIVSPLFLSRFLVSILSSIVVIFGIYFISIGIKLINQEGY